MPLITNCPIVSLDSLAIMVTVASLLETLAKTSDRYPVTLMVNPPQLSTTDWVKRSPTARIDGNYRQAIFCLYQGDVAVIRRAWGNWDSAKSD